VRERWGTEGDFFLSPYRTYHCPSPPGFRTIFEIATIREGSDVVLKNEPPQTTVEQAGFDWSNGTK